jgi:hypothetical protein
VLCQSGKHRIDFGSAGLPSAVLRLHALCMAVREKRAPQPVGALRANRQASLRRVTDRPPLSRQSAPAGHDSHRVVTSHRANSLQRSPTQSTARAIRGGRTRSATVRRRPESHSAPDTASRRRHDGPVLPSHLHYPRLHPARPQAACQGVGRELCRFTLMEVRKAW